MLVVILALPVVAEWILQPTGNGLAAASPAYGFNLRHGTNLAWLLAMVAPVCFYLALALGKTAFGLKLLRISSGRTRALLWLVSATVWAFAVAICVASCCPFAARIRMFVFSLCPAEFLLAYIIDSADESFTLAFSWVS